MTMTNWCCLLLVNAYPALGKLQERSDIRERDQTFFWQAALPQFPWLYRSVALTCKPHLTNILKNTRRDLSHLTTPAVV
jgi:hypothetical protein